jgi:hypothetical protein
MTIATEQFRQEHPSKASARLRKKGLRGIPK